MLRKYSKVIIALLTVTGCLTTTAIHAESSQVWPPEKPHAAISVLQRSAVLGTTNSPHPHFVVINEGSVPLSLGRLKLRYWFNCDCQLETTVIAGWTDWVGVLPSGSDITPKLRGYFDTTTRGGQTNAVVMGFQNDPPVLQPGQSVEIHIHFAREDWSDMNQDNDWSYAPYTNYGTSNRVTGYIDDVLVWGQEP
jgi:hypothetical protein